MYHTILPYCNTVPYSVTILQNLPACTRVSVSCSQRYCLCPIASSLPAYVAFCRCRLSCCHMLAPPDALLSSWLIVKSSHQPRPQPRRPSLFVTACLPPPDALIALLSLLLSPLVFCLPPSSLFVARLLLICRRLPSSLRRSRCSSGYQRIYLCRN